MTPLDPVLASLTDAELLRRSRRQPEAFGVFYERHARDVFRLVRRSVESQEIALELTAETFAQALRSAHRFRAADGTGGGWLAGIANHLVANYRRRRRVEDSARSRYGIRELTTFPDPEDDSARRLDAAAQAGVLAEAIESLPASERAAVELRVIDEAPYETIATRLGVSENAARVRVHRGLTRLRARLGGGPEWTK